MIACSEECFPLMQHARAPKHMNTMNPTPPTVTSKKRENRATTETVSQRKQIFQLCYDRRSQKSQSVDVPRDVGRSFSEERNQSVYRQPDTNGYIRHNCTLKIYIVRMHRTHEQTSNSLTMRAITVLDDSPPVSPSPSSWVATHTTATSLSV